MANQQLDEEAIFHVARKIDDTEARQAYSAQVCAGDQGLQERVEELLEVHDDEQEFLKSSSEPAPTIDQPPITERPGTTIGRYRLREQIGEGGMGIVFVAEQERPIQRKVALKVIKPGMDSKAVIARFDVERQALAMMDHPNIAKVLDAGTTGSGRPYFVMELVRGVPITEYCDENKFSIAERLELFTQVCQAIQHAHQKGIIHRDIKPTNVLVTLHDDKPVIKVIDFGVAKAVSQRLTEQTVYTGFAQAIGTPLYMSPEQAGASGLDIDTRTDIYSLGVLLYELLTGTTPFDKQQFDQAAYEEVRRIIREQEPAKPSTRISTLGATLRNISAQRKMDPQRLCRFVRGDLDWIVMKSLEKDRQRRYETASSLAADVQRFLDDEPVEACPPSVAYRFQKFASRNRVTLATSAIVLVSLVSGIFGTSWMSIRLTSALKEKTEVIERLGMVAYQDAVAKAAGGEEVGAQAALNIVKDANIPYADSKIGIVKGLIALTGGRPEEAIEFAKQALAADTHGDEDVAVGSRSILTSAYLSLGQLHLYEENLAKLRNMNPQSDTGRLLMAHALVFQNPNEAIQKLTGTPTMLRSPTGVFIRGQVSILKGLDTHDRQRVEQAIRDLAVVQFQLSNSPAVVTARIHALAAAIALAQLDGDSAAVARFVQEGRPLVDSMASETDYPWAGEICWLFYTAAEDEELAWLATQRHGRLSGYFAISVACGCLRRWSMPIAAEEFERAFDHIDEDDPCVRLARAHLTSGGPKRAEQVQELVDELVEQPSVILRRHALTALCLVSDSLEDVRQRALEATSDLNEDAYRAEDLFNGAACLDLLRGAPEEVLLKDAQGHEYALANLHFTLGMMRLAEKDRRGALEQFQKCADTHVIGSLDYELGRAYLIRMTNDDLWPPLTP